MSFAFGADFRLRGFGASENPAPAGFRWPSAADYSSELIKTVSVMAPDVGKPESTGPISPPIQTQVVALRSSLEAATGLPFGQLEGLAGNVNALANAQAPVQIVAAIGDLVGSGLSVAADTLEALAITSDVIEVIPVVGQVVSFVFKALVAIFSNPSRMDRLNACRQALFREELDPYCRHVSAISNDIAKTGYEETVTGSTTFTSPADMFRPLAYKYAAGSKQYPANISTLLLMLCGGAAGDFGISDSKYEAIVHAVRTGSMGTFSTGAPPNPKAGLSSSVRRRLWQLIKATMACVQDPNDPYPVAKADQGRTPMPIALDIVRVAKLRGQIDDMLLTLLANESLAWTQRTRQCPTFFEYEPVYGSCRTMLVPNMLSQFEDMNRDFRVRLYNGFADPRSPDPSHPRLLPTPATGIMGVVIDMPDLDAVAKVPTPSGKLSYHPTLKFGEGTVAGMAAALRDIERAQRGGDFVAGLFKAALGAAAGYGGYRLARGRGWLR